MWMKRESNPLFIVSPTAFFVKISALIRSLPEIDDRGGWIHDAVHNVDHHLIQLEKPLWTVCDRDNRKQVTPLHGPSLDCGTVVPSVSDRDQVVRDVDRWGRRSRRLKDAIC